MQVAIELSPMFSYSLLIILIIVVIIILLIIFYPKKKKNNTTVTNVIIPSEKDIQKIKNKYLTEIKRLAINFNENKISNRMAFQQLSLIIRNFIHEATNIQVQNYTLSEIKQINMPILYELVSEYYDPEFCKISKGNVLQSIAKTKEVIEKWN